MSQVSTPTRSEYLSMLNVAHSIAMTTSKKLIDSLDGLALSALVNPVSQDAKLEYEIRLERYHEVNQRIKEIRYVMNDYDSPMMSKVSYSVLIRFCELMHFEFGTVSLAGSTSKTDEVKMVCSVINAARMLHKLNSKSGKKK